MLSAVAASNPCPVPVPFREHGPLVRDIPTLSRPEAEALLDAHRSGIYAFIRRKGFGAEEADDLTQETLIRAYTHLSGFRGMAMGAWLYRIAANVAVDHLRRQRLATVPLEALTLADADSPDLTAGIHRAERRKQMEGIIHALPACHQRVLHLRFFEDRSLDEIAGLLHCSRMAAKLRVFRAVTALRKHCRALGAEATALTG